MSGLGVVNLLMGFNELASVLLGAPPHGDDGDDRAVMICLVTDRRRLSTRPRRDRSARRSRRRGCAGRHRSDSGPRARSRGASAGRAREPMPRCGRRAAPRRCSSTIASTLPLATGAHGVHLRGDSVSVAAARLLLGGHALVGRSVHSADEAAAARERRVDYLIFGALYQTASKDAGHPIATPG